MFWCLRCLLLQIIHKFPEQYIIRSSGILVLLTLRSRLKLQEIEWWCFLDSVWKWVSYCISCTVGSCPQVTVCSSGRRNVSGVWMLNSVSKSVFTLVSHTLSFLFTWLQWLVLMLTLPVCIYIYIYVILMESHERQFWMYNFGRICGLIFIAILSFAVLMVLLEVKVEGWCLWINFFKKIPREHRIIKVAYNPPVMNP